MSESKLTKTLLKLFSKNDSMTIFDIGSCEGLNSVHYCMTFPRASIHAFEPLPVNVALIYTNLEKHGKKDSVKVHQLAMSDSMGSTDFFVSSGTPPNSPGDEGANYSTSSSSLLQPDKILQIHPWLKFDEKVTVKTVTLQSFCRENNIKTIDFIHMDVQGGELLVLNGAGDFLNAIKAIYLEVEMISLYKKQPVRSDIEYFMTKNGFLKILDELEYVTGDQLYVNKIFFPSYKPVRNSFKRELSYLKNRIKLNLSIFFKKKRQ